MNGKYEKGNPLGIMPKLKSETRKPSEPKKEPQKTVIIAQPEEPKSVKSKPRYTSEELRKGLEVSVVLGAPRARDPYKIGKRAK